MRWRPAWILGPALLAAAFSRGADPVMLPPFLVEDAAPTSPQTWIHGVDEHYEVLSACAESETQDFVQQLRRRRQELERIAPADFLLQSTLPTTLILYPSSRKREIGDAIVHLIRQSRQGAPAPGRLQPLEDLRLSEPDSTFIFAFLDDWDWWTYQAQHKATGRSYDIVFTPGYVRFLLESRAPALPDWYVTGMAQFYDSATSSRADFLGPGMNWNRFLADPWISEESARALAAHPEAPRSLVPLAELFTPLAPAEKSAAYRATWAAEAELFVRWALSNRLADGPEKLQRFVAASAAAPPSEEAFQAAFGLNYADALEALSDYLPIAVRDPIETGLASGPVGAPMPLDEATPAEVRRIKGEWSRRALRVIRQSDPVALPLFVEEARRLLQGAYDRGDRDYRLQASLALFRIDQGDQAGAAALLAADPRVAAARPLGEVELALWRLDQALARPEGADKALSEEQAAAVLAIVDRARGQAPPLEATYRIAARVAEHAGADPSAEALARLNEGARLFPRNPVLVMKSAAWDLRAGDSSAALRLAELGLAESGDAVARAQLTTLRDLAAKVGTASN